MLFFLFSRKQHLKQQLSLKEKFESIRSFLKIPLLNVVLNVILHFWSMQILFKFWVLKLVMIMRNFVDGIKLCLIYYRRLNEKEIYIHTWPFKNYILLREQTDVKGDFRLILEKYA